MRRTLKYIRAHQFNQNCILTCETKDFKKYLQCQVRKAQKSIYSKPSDQSMTLKG